MPHLKSAILKWWRAFFKEPDGARLNPFSLKDLAKAGLKIRPAGKGEYNEKSLIHASQLSPHVLPWTALLKSGVYCIHFSPELKSRISGALLASNVGALPSQSVVSAGLNPLVALSSVLLYQAGVMVFGAWHLKKISESLGNLNKKLDDVHNFQQDRRSSKIKAHFQEFLHLSEGIVEFKEKGNIAEIQRRLKTIRHIRLINGAHLLHLRKNLIDRRVRLTRLTGSAVVFKSEKELSELMSAIEAYGKNLMDYKLSLFLDIICVNVETVFSLARSFRETESRLKAGQSHIKFFQEETALFETSLFEKIPKLIKKGLFEREGDLNERKKKAVSAWKNVKNEIISDFDQECGKHIKSTKEALERPSILFLEIK